MFGLVLTITKRLFLNCQSLYEDTGCASVPHLAKPSTQISASSAYSRQFATPLLSAHFGRADAPPICASPQFALTDRHEHKALLTMCFGLLLNARKTESSSFAVGHLEAGGKLAEQAENLVQGRAGRVGAIGYRHAGSMYVGQILVLFNLLLIELKEAHDVGAILYLDHHDSEEYFSVLRTVPTSKRSLRSAPDTSMATGSGSRSPRCAV